MPFNLSEQQRPLEEHTISLLIEGKGRLIAEPVKGIVILGQREHVEAWVLEYLLRTSMYYL